MNSHNLEVIIYILILCAAFYFSTDGCSDSTGDPDLYEYERDDYQF